MNKIKQHERTKLSIRIFICIMVLLIIAGGAFMYIFYRQYLSDGWHEISSGVYHMTENKRDTGLCEINDWYYLFDSEGILLYGWNQFDGAYFWSDEDGVVARGETEVDGVLYNFSRLDGRMYVGVTVSGADKYCYDEHGYPLSGVVEYKGYKYVFGEDGKAMTEFAVHGGDLYYLGYEGEMAYGFVYDDVGNSYYFGDDGKAYSGANEIRGKWYYFDPETHIMQTGLVEHDGGKYYYTGDGYAVAGDYEIDGTMVYVDEKGHIAGGWQTENNYTIYLDIDGKKLTGYQKIEDDSYYFDSDGHMCTGFVNIDGTKYFFGPDGKMVTGLYSENGLTYIFGTDGKMLTGEVTYNGEKYRLGDDGVLKTGWSADSAGNKIYLASNGYPATGKTVVDGFTYYFDNNGACVTGWVKDSGKNYYFKLDGTMATDTVIGLYSIGSDGAASVLAASEDNLDYYISEMVKLSGKTARDIYSYVRSIMSYKRMDKDTPSAMVVYAINYRRGSCYHYAYLTEYLLKAAGYEAITIHGLGLDTNGDGVRDAAEHYWNMVKIDGVWYHLDTLQKQYLKTDRQLLTLGYSWTRSEFPSA